MGHKVIVSGNKPVVNTQGGPAFSGLHRILPLTSFVSCQNRIRHGSRAGTWAFPPLSATSAPYRDHRARVCHREAERYCVVKEC